MMLLGPAKKINLKAAAIIALVIVGIALVSTTFAALSANQNVPTNGAVTVSANLGIYSDSGCTVPLSSLSWGNITAGTNVQRTVYIKNTGSGCSLTLNMTTSAGAHRTRSDQ